MVDEDMQLKDTLFRCFHLLVRAEEHFAEVEKAPDAEWFRDYYTLLRRPMVLTEEGWEPPSCIEEYRKQDPSWEPLETLTFETPVPIHPHMIKNLADIDAKLARQIKE